MNKPTYYAKILVDELKKRGVEIRLEHNDGHKSVDIFIPSVKLDIEIDGSQHITDPYQALTDLKRTKNSLKEGRITLRIPNTAIYQNVLGVADDILDIVNDLKSKTKKEKIKELIKRKETKPIGDNKLIFNYSKQRPIKKITIDKGGWKKYFFIGIILLGLIIVGYSYFNNENLLKQTQNYSGEDNINSISEQPKIEPIVVTGSKTDVIIKNNLQKDVSLNVTYKVYSNWFGKDSTESNVFEINAGEEKSFKVYDNDGCNTAPCSVSILNFEEVGYE